MEEIISYRITWLTFLFWLALLVGLYLVLQSAQRLWPGITSGKGLKGQIKLALHYILILYEPLIILIIGSLFVLLNPILHGGILAILLLAGFPHLRNYVSGRIVRIDRAVHLGVQLQTSMFTGIVTGLGNLGIKLKTSEGIFYVTYSSLLSEGYTLLSGEKVGGFYHLQVRSAEEEEAAVPLLEPLMDRLATAPYIDWNHKPEWTPANGRREYPELRVLIREESHLYELMRLMKEWGYHSQLLSDRT